MLEALINKTKELKGHLSYCFYDGKSYNTTENIRFKIYFHDMDKKDFDKKIKQLKMWIECQFHLNNNNGYFFIKNKWDIKVQHCVEKERQNKPWGVVEINLEARNQ